MFFGLFGKKKSFICIDIGYRNIKVVEVKLKKDLSVAITNYGIAQTPAESIRNGQIVDVPAVVQEINAIIKKHKMKAKLSKIIMSGTNIITSIVIAEQRHNLPLDSIILEKVVPYDMGITAKQDYRINYKLLQTMNNGGRESYKVFITAVPRIVLNSYVKVLNSLKLKPQAIDIPGNSVAKFFERTFPWNDTLSFGSSDVYYKHSGDVFAVIDFGSETTIVNIIKNKILEFNNVILLGSSNMDKLISKELDIPATEAERLKGLFGLIPAGETSSEKHERVNIIINEYMATLTGHIKKQMDTYQSKFGDKPIKKVYIIGGGSQLPGLREHLEEALQINVYPVNLLDFNNISMRKGLPRDQFNYLVNSIGISL